MDLMMPLIGLGFVSAVVIASQCQDRIYKHLSKINGDKGQPEYRVCSGCSIKFSLTILYAAGTDSNRHVYHANRIIYFCKCNAFIFLCVNNSIKGVDSPRRSTLDGAFRWSGCHGDWVDAGIQHHPEFVEWSQCMLRSH